jgi:lysophospholipase L1-like esterase
MKTFFRFVIATIALVLFAACAASAPTPVPPAPTQAPVVEPTREPARKETRQANSAQRPAETDAAETRAAESAPPTVTVAPSTPLPTETVAPSPTPTTAAPTHKIKIMSLGDSVPFGWPDTTYGGWQHLLPTLLTNDGYSFDFVGSQRNGKGVIPYPDNEGHPGWTITELKDGIDSKGWLETYKPDIILLNIGGNDILKGDEAAAPGYLSGLLDDILKRLPQAHVIVAQLIHPRSGPSPEHQPYNAAIPGIVASEGARVSMVNLDNVLSSGDYAADGIHPNSGGYDKLARAWEPAIRAVASPAR